MVFDKDYKNGTDVDHVPLQLQHKVHGSTIPKHCSILFLCSSPTFFATYNKLISASMSCIVSQRRILRLTLVSISSWNFKEHFQGTRHSNRSLITDWEYLQLIIVWFGCWIWVCICLCCIQSALSIKIASLSPGRPGISLCLCFKSKDTLYHMPWTKSVKIATAHNYMCMGVHELISSNKALTIASQELVPPLSAMSHWMCQPHGVFWYARNMYRCPYVLYFVRDAAVTILRYWLDSEQSCMHDGRHVHMPEMFKAQSQKIQSQTSDFILAYLMYIDMLEPSLELHTPLLVQGTVFVQMSMFGGVMLWLIWCMTALYKLMRITSFQSSLYK